ncbi:MAG: L-aspartate oxidase [Mangrovibacterium sp.]
MQKMKFDTIIAGSGLAGLTAAFHASKYGTVALITKSEVDTSNSYYAQGGIAGAIDEGDSPALHFEDTLVAGRGLCEKDAVEILVNEGRERLLELIAMGMQFDRIGGKLVLGLEGGHNKRRILHAGGDATGKELTCFMLEKVLEQKNIRVFEYTAITSLIIREGVCRGAQALDFRNGANILFEARACILATGGLSRIFSRTTNPHTATGDGIALAYEAGAQLEDMEFIQFHPSALCIENQDAFLISEAVRGEGAWLLNKEGQRFMKEIHPLAELAPRDVVAFSIYNQMKKDKCPYVHLSLRHLDPQKVKSRFSNICKKLKEFGYDLTTDLLPIAPAAHYMVGGIKTDLNGETNIPGLFACGEVASTGVMGANRLASNSLLECLVFGKRASEKAATISSQHSPVEGLVPMTNLKENEAFFLALKNEIADLMSEKVGIVRNESDLAQAMDRLTEIMSKINPAQNDYNLLKRRQVTQICKLIVRSALLRKESRGGHIREEYKQEDPDYRVHIIQQKGREPEFVPVKE